MGFVLDEVFFWGPEDMVRSREEVVALVFNLWTTLGMLLIDDPAEHTWFSVCARAFVLYVSVFRNELT